MSAIRKGATCVNHVEVVHLLFDKVKHGTYTIEGAVEFNADLMIC